MTGWLSVLAILLAGWQVGRPPGFTPTRPDCKAEPGRKFEELRGSVVAGAAFRQTTPSGWLLQLRPSEQGWNLSLTTKDRETEDLARMTPPWHGPNALNIRGWNLRNADNTGPNDGSVNVAGEIREFIFSPAIGRGIEFTTASTVADVEKVRAFGRGWLFIESYRLTPPRRGEFAAFEAMTFSACLTWPAS